MKNIVIIGATSAIAEAVARRWAARGDRLFLVARNDQRLEATAADLRARGAALVGTHRMDATDLAGQSSMLDEATRVLGSIDLVLIAYGTLPDQKACEASAELTTDALILNGVSVVVLMQEVARRLEARGRGAIAVISSVAGDRGRASNAVYGSAKAMVTAAASGLRQRFHGSQITVVTIKPGFIDTPMTAAFDKGPLWATPDKVAEQLVKACDGRSRTVYVPGFWWLIMLAIRSLPEALFARLKI